jgi:Cu(I)/Ag(I) efflux system membrane fusion protein
MTAIKQVRPRGYGIILLTLLLGVAIGSLGFYWLDGALAPSSESAKDNNNDPLYWVAPMDANFRRDKPGKSPMGMDLVAVYSSAGEIESAGLVSISPTVVNNLGVRLTTVVNQPLATEIQTVGYVKYNEDLLVHIHPRVEGWVEKLYVKSAGDPVLEGQPLYDLYSPELVNAQEEYLLALQRNNETLVHAARQRLLSLQIPKAVIADLRRSRQVKSTTTFFSPQRGVVDNLEIREGFYVKPGTNLMTIGALDEVWVEAEVFERQASLIDTGASVTMTLDYLPGRQWQGQVDYIYPTLDPVTRTLRLRLRFANADQALKPNMFAEININSRPTAPTLLVPREALIRTGKGDRVVLALGEGKFRAVQVRTGRVSALQAEILEGLKEGQSIVSSGQFLLDSESSKTADLQRLYKPVNNETEIPLDQMPSETMDHSQHQMPAKTTDHSQHQMPVETMDHSQHQKEPQQ